MPSTDPTREPPGRAFCSYTHRDNETFSNAIDHLVHDFRALYEAETGRALEIFFDRSSIGWGQDLRAAISDSVEEATFFIPIITANYFQSRWCREELLSFYGKCQAIGVTELILPIILAGKPLVSEESEDEVVRIIARVNHIDWTRIWQRGRGSEAWNRGLTELVQRLVALQERVEERLAYRAYDSSAIRLGTEVGKQDADDAGEGSPSSHLDLVGASSRSGLERIAYALDDFSGFLGELNEEFAKIEIGINRHDIRSSLDGSAAKFAARGHNLERTARDGLEQLVEFDAILRAMVRSAHLLDNPEQSSALSGEVGNLRNSAREIGQLIREVNAKADVLRLAGQVSIGLRKALSPARAALQSMRDVAHILDGWAHLEVVPPVAR